MPSFYIPISGLNSDSTALNTIANNLTNMNTTGYKEKTTQFSDLFYQQVGNNGSGDEIQVGSGVQVAANSTDFTDGSISSTGVYTDAAISGSGFFVLDNGNSGTSQLYTRAGNFQVSSTGTLESSDGKAVMGYVATNGVVSTSGSVSDITIPTGQIMQPSATSTFSMTQNLDSTAEIGATATGNVTIYDSLGNSYDATVTYTKTANNTWSYAVTLPDTLTATPSTTNASNTLSLLANAAVSTSVPMDTTSVTPATTVAVPLSSGTGTTASVTTTLGAAATHPASVSTTTVVPGLVSAAGTDTDTLTFAATGTVAGTTSITITGPATGGGTTSIVVTPSVADESVAAFFTDINTAIAGSTLKTGVGGVNVANPSSNVLTIAGPTATYALTGTTKQDVALTTTNYNFVTSNGSLATVDPTTSLGITVGAIGPISAPAFTTSEDLTTYAANLTTALATAGITGVTVANNSGVLAVTGPSNMTITGSVKQDFTAANTTYSFGTYVDPTTSSSTTATVDSTSSLTITAPTTAGTNTTITVTPSIASGETVAQYAADITTALTAANVTGVTVTATNGVLKISAPTAATVTGYVNEDTLGTTVASSVTGATSSTVSSSTTTLAASPTTPASTTTTTLTAGTATAAAVTASTLLAQPGTAAGTVIYNFPTSNSTVATVDPGTTLTFTGHNAVPALVSIVAPTVTANETVAQYVTALQGAITTAGITDVTVSSVGGQLTISGPAAMTTAGVVKDDFTGTSSSFTLGSTASIDTNTNFTITGPTTSGGTASITAPTITANETPATYAAALQTALTTAGITGVTVTHAGTNITVTGPTTISTGGSLIQDVAMTTTNYNFVTSESAVATVDPTTTLSISEGAIGPVTAPTFTSSETVSTYATKLQTALTTAGITDVTVSVSSGVLSIKGPSNMTIAGTVKQDFSAVTTNYDFSSYTDPNSGLTQTAYVSPATSLSITGPTTSGGSSSINVSPSNPAGESLTAFIADVQTALTAAHMTGITLTQTNGVLSVTGPSTVSLAGSVKQDMLGTTNNYTFETNATVDPSTSLLITGSNASGTTTTISAPAVSSGETVAQYAAALTSAITTAGIANVTVTATGNTLSIVGANLSSSGTLVQGLADTTINYDFGSSATVDPSTAITIVGPTTSGTPVTAITVAPTVTTGETVAQYAAALNQALTAAGINTGTDGVSVTANGGRLSIVGPAAYLKTAGTASQDLSTTTTTYDFGSSGNTLATVATTTNLTITGLTAEGKTATTTAPTITAGESINQYAQDLNTALKTAGIAGITVTASSTGVLSITGSNVSTSGKVIQEPVSSTNANGTLTFNSSGNLITPAQNVSAITFSGLSDGAATMNMTWSLYNSSNTGQISQTASSSNQSGKSQNGYTSGTYESFTIDSSGLISASFSNSQTQSVAQLGIATVNNLQGLQAEGSNEYTTTTSSGDASLGVADSGGRGAIEGSSLEASNVNISTEFSDLIIAQRAFEANSKSITTFDTITQETINMIH